MMLLFNLLFELIIQKLLKYAYAYAYVIVSDSQLFVKRSYRVAAHFAMFYEEMRAAVFFLANPISDQNQNN